MCIQVESSQTQNNVCECVANKNVLLVRTLLWDRTTKSSVNPHLTAQQTNKVILGFISTPRWSPQKSLNSTSWQDPLFQWAYYSTFSPPNASVKSVDFLYKKCDEHSARKSHSRIVWTQVDMTKLFYITLIPFPKRENRIIQSSQEGTRLDFPPKTKGGQKNCSLILLQNATFPKQLQKNCKTRNKYQDCKDDTRWMATVFLFFSTSSCPEIWMGVVAKLKEWKWPSMTKVSMMS